MASPRPDLPALLDDLTAEQEDLRRLVEGADLDTPTPAEGWDVRDAVSHLMGTDVEAARAAARPDEFVAMLPDVAADIEAFLGSQLEMGRELTADRLLAAWQERFAALLDALRALAPGTSVPWYGPPMSPASFATARLMEYWAHGQDVADGLGVMRTPTARLRHVCHLGVRTRGFSYVLRGLPVPEADVRVELIAPDGSTWTWGSGPDRVSGSALGFALRVTQRRHRDDTDLVAEGAAADSWLDVAQCFAGLPGPGRPPTSGRPA